jgi:hypothetical protein
MKPKDTFDFWYAVNNTKIVKMPSQHLETFGSTILNYHLVSALMDTVDRTRVREGRMHAYRPKIITPEAYSKTILDGFGDDARKYVDWLKDHEKEIHILQYGYSLRKEEFSEHVISDNIDAVAERVQDEVREKNDPFSAVVLGVDEPWDVCLIRLFWEVIRNSASSNFMEIEKKHATENRALRDEIDVAFQAASRNSALISALGSRLQELGLFEEYEERFFSLLKSKRKG